MSPSEFLDLACAIVRTPSVTTEGTRPLVRLLCERVLSRTDLEVRIERGPSDEQVNLLAVKPGGGQLPPLLWNSHLDTVAPGDPSLWTDCGGDPFAGSVRGDWLYGLGAADAKLDWLCKAEALRRFTGKRFRRGILFLGTFGEERGLLGARAFLARMPARPVAAWAGEPSELELVTRHKGLLVVAIAARDPRPAPRSDGETSRLTVRGRSAHSSSPHLGQSAIALALDLVRDRALTICSIDGGDAANKVPARCDLEVLGSLSPSELPSTTVVRERGRRAPLPRALQDFLVAALDEVQVLVADAGGHDPAFSPPGPTANLGRLEATAAGARLVADIRCLPGEGSAPVLARLEAFLGSWRRRGLHMELTVERDNPPLDAREESPVVVWSLSALAAVGLSTTLRTKSGCTEAGLYASAGIPAVVFGPGISVGNVHAPNERVSISHLERAVEFYARLLEDTCHA